MLNQEVFSHVKPMITIIIYTQLCFEVKKNILRAVCLEKMAIDVKSTKRFAHSCRGYQNKLKSGSDLESKLYVRQNATHNIHFVGPGIFNKLTFLWKSIPANGLTIYVKAHSTDTWTLDILDLNYEPSFYMNYQETW